MLISRQPIQESDILVRTWPHRMPPGMSLSFYQRDWVQLVYAIEGVMTVASDHGAWIVPPHRAVWVPAGVAHQVTAHGNLSLRSLYFHNQPNLPAKCLTIGVTPLVRELINHIALEGALLKSQPKHRRLARVLTDLLQQLPALPLHLPMPTSPEAIDAATALRDWLVDLDEIALKVGLSKRTLERRFHDETGLSLGAWRQQAKLIESMRMLAAGEAVGQIAFLIGYQSPSAYISAFRKSFGVSPGAMFATPQPNPWSPASDIAIKSN